MTAWPWPDNRLDRRSRIAHMYRDALADEAPHICAELDDAMRAYGQTWITDTTPIDPEALLTTVELAAIADINETTIRKWAHRGHIKRAATQGKTALYRWGDIIDIQRKRTAQRTCASNRA